jgi:hypothetical protein
MAVGIDQADAIGMFMDKLDGVDMANETVVEPDWFINVSQTIQLTSSAFSFIPRI